ncbi:hypothetical protein ABEB36_014982 [Hypothenemus hampei]|uniref:DUF4817 domain-containing protein n=1 Tax=Hypothenemus hampei TaxID=57062 RepID=A0ABD1E632_HYPHA
MFSNNEKVDILIIFGQCGRNAAAAERVYREEYRDKRHYPSRQYILYLIQKMRQESNVQQEKIIISEEVEIKGLDAVRSVEKSIVSITFFKLFYSVFYVKHNTNV